MARSPHGLLRRDGQANSLAAASRGGETGRHPRGNTVLCHRWRRERSPDVALLGHVPDHREGQPVHPRVQAAQRGRLRRGQVASGSGMRGFLLGGRHGPEIK